MRPTSLLMLAKGLESVPAALLPAFEAQLSERDERLGAIKPHEAASVLGLVGVLEAAGATSPPYYEGFVFSFRIPQISCEFDLLRISDDAVVNIELKSRSVGARRVGEQLRRNRHYLAPLGRAVHAFTFVSDASRVYELGETGSVRQVPPTRLVQALAMAGNAYEGRVEDLFKVSNYLVSPLNDTQKFLAGTYFLTNHQAQIKASVLRGVAGGGRGTAFVVYGGAGTGKSLLLYDLARTLGASRPACVIHCGLLSEGHRVLNAEQGSFHIVSARGWERLDLSKYGAILVDEAQRMWPSQIRRLVAYATQHGMPLYLSLDRRQVLVRREDAYDAEKVVREACPQASVWELSSKIRTNRELADFIRALFGLRGAERYVRTSHVKVASASDAAGARVLVDAFRGEGYQYISLAYAQRDEPVASVLDIPGCPNPNTVIGQEFDKVVMALGSGFSPDGDYLHRQLLYQGLTRARSNIALVVYQNEPLLERLVGML